MSNIDVKKDLAIDMTRIPSHIAVIMDGNGRWASKQGLNRVNGHSEGVNSARDVIEASVDLGVKYLTLYVFSKENWKRPEFEVNLLMSLLVETIYKEIDSLMEKNVKVVTIGETEDLPVKAKQSLFDVIEKTKNNGGMRLVLAISYSGREEILHAVNKLLDAGIKNVTEDDFKKCLYLENAPDPELMIRTGGEMRISNFLLWQAAYTELYITEKYWPEFRKDDFITAVISYQNRERRFGKTSEQLKGETIV